MVRKAVTLESLDELNLPKGVKTYIKNNFESLDKAIRHSRTNCYMQDLGCLYGKIPNWELELASALRSAGFIRPATDFAITFNIGALYRSVFTKCKDEFVTHVHQLSNEQYEDFKGLSDEVIGAIKATLRERLNDEEYEVINSRFGLDGDCICESFRSIGNQLGITERRARRVELIALKKLKYPKAKLPTIFNISFEEDGGADVYINELDLNVRIYNCLMCAGIHTIHDVINYPKKDWLKVKNLGHKSLEELVKAMHKAGYEDFNLS